MLIYIAKVMPVEYIRADKLNFDPRPQLGRIFAEGFYLWVRHVSKDKHKLAAVFAHTFLLEQFYVAACGNKIAAMAACTRGDAPVRFERGTFVDILGFIRGNFNYFRLKRQMLRNAYPFRLGRETGSIEFVATSPEYRRQGIAHELILYTMGENPYDAYVLEAADTNTHAVRLYEKLGFKEIKRVKAPSPKRSGVDFFLYMRKEL